MTRQRIWLCIASGCLWGGVGYLCALPFLGEAAAGAAIVSPVLGLFAGRILASVRPRDLVGFIIASGVVYCATAACFGVISQLTAELGFTNRPFLPLHGSSLQRVAMAPVMAVFGAGMFGVVLGPLALLNTFVFYMLDEPDDQLAG